MPIPLDRSLIGRRLLLPETLVLEADFAPTGRHASKTS